VERVSYAAIDVLTSPTLKHLREHWWSDEFTSFLRDTLRPRPGNRILHVGCGRGTGEIAIGRLHLSQIRLFGIDLIVSRVTEARKATAAHNQRVGFAAADVCRLPFPDGTFDSTYCVAALQHIRDVTAAVGEIARVTKNNGRVLAVEPDNGGRYWFSSTPSGAHAYESGLRFFGALAEARGDRTDPAVGPKLPAIFARNGIEPLSVKLFPVSQASVGSPPEAVWTARRESVQKAIDQAPTPGIAAMGQEYLKLLDSYARDAHAAGSAFVEIQNTLLFATVGQRSE
jgi:SAM-dependent methyltransferase